MTGMQIGNSKQDVNECPIQILSVQLCFLGFTIYFCLPHFNLFFCHSSIGQNTVSLHCETISVMLMVPKSSISLARVICSEDTFAGLFILPGQAVVLYMLSASKLGSSSALSVSFFCLADVNHLPKQGGQKTLNSSYPTALTPDHISLQSVTNAGKNG